MINVNDTKTVITTKNFFLSQEFAKVAIFHCGDSIEGKRVASVAELKGPDCGSATKENDKDAKVENPDYVDEDIIELKCYSHQ